MAVIVKYIVVRDGVEKMTFTTKKEADAYDKMLDIAYNLLDFINESSNVELDEKQVEDLSFFLAENKEKTMSILKGVKMKPSKTSTPNKKDAKNEKTAAAPKPNTSKAKIRKVG